MRPSVEFFLIDAFTDKPSKGNPAAVCLLPSDAEEGLFTDAWMQSVASEMNLSETAFLTKLSQKETGHCSGSCNQYSLRWFTPMVEVTLCGHATLASAHILWERGYAESGSDINFQTRSGLLAACKKNGLIELEFPADPVTEAAPPDDIIQMLGAVPLYVGRGRDDYLIEVGSEEKVRSLSPDITALKKIPVASDGFQPRGFIVTAKADNPGSGYDFVSRFFAPSAGIDEDPVTGSAYCTLVGYWGGKLGKTEMTGYQASERGGYVNVALSGDSVTLGGEAVTVYVGHLEG